MRAALLFVCLTGAIVFAQTPKTFKTRLSPVPIDLTMQATVAGSGSVTASAAPFGPRATPRSTGACSGSTAAVASVWWMSSYSCSRSRRRAGSATSMAPARSSQGDRSIRTGAVGVLVGVGPTRAGMRRQLRVAAVGMVVLAGTVVLLVAGLA